MSNSWCELIIGILIIVFALWTIPVISEWILLILGIILIVHSFMCKSCFLSKSMPMKSSRRR